jgi:hypothetical protein
MAGQRGWVAGAWLDNSGYDYKFYEFYSLPS